LRVALFTLDFFFVKLKPGKKNMNRRSLVFLVLAAFAACALAQESSSPMAPSPQRE